MSDSESSDPGDVRGGLASRGFLAFLLTQFLGAMNDNMFRWIVVPLAKTSVDEEYEAWVLTAGSVFLILPFILFASYAGYLADRFSKRTVIIGCKIAEIAMMLIGVVVFWIGDIYLLFLVVALMGTQSALFGPSKMGIIPEIVRPDKLSSANGLVGLTTVISVVVGTIAGNLLFAEFLDPKNPVSVWPPALAIVSVAVIGWLTSLLIRPVPTANSNRRFPRNPAAETISNLRLLGQSRPILRVALGMAFFWSLAAMAQLNIDAFATNKLSLTQDQVGPLLGILAGGWAWVAC